MSRISKTLLVVAALAGQCLAATITQSTIVEDAAQRDGRRWITERHTDNAGVQHFVRYIAAAGADVNATMTARAPSVASELENREVTDNIRRALSDAPYTPTTVYCSNNQLRSGVREIYRTVSGWPAICLGKNINALNLTDPQLTSLFGVSGAQLTALKNKLANATTKFNEVTAEAGQ